MDKDRVAGSTSVPKGTIKSQSKRSLTMHKALGAVLASIVFATSAIPTSASAQWRPFERQDRVIQHYCSNNWDEDCRDWEHNRHRWNESRYQRWYRDHHGHRGFHPDAAAALLFGLAVRAMGTAIQEGATTSHVAACERRYRSYDRSSDTYLGYDGQRHYCRL